MKKSFNETTFRQGKLFYKVWANKATTNVDKYGSRKLSIFSYLLVSPINVRKRLAHLINQEIKNTEKGRKSSIILKINLVDEEMIDLLYKASQAGVVIKMIVRAMCSLKAGVPGLSENIHIISSSPSVYKGFLHC